MGASTSSFQAVCALPKEVNPARQQTALQRRLKLLRLQRRLRPLRPLKLRRLKLLKLSHHHHQASADTFKAPYTRLPTLGVQPIAPGAEINTMPAASKHPKSCANRGSITASALEMEMFL